LFLFGLYVVFFWCSKAGLPVVSLCLPPLPFLKVGAPCGRKVAGGRAKEKCPIHGTYSSDYVIKTEIEIGRSYHTPIGLVFCHYPSGFITFQFASLLTFS
jgi:hypothetical protein